MKNKAVYVALALNREGEKEVLGLWIEQSEGAKFWLKVMNELKTRGVNDVLMRSSTGLRASGGDRDGVPANHGADLHRALIRNRLALCRGRIAR